MLWPVLLLFIFLTPMFFLLGIGVKPGVDDIKLRWQMSSLLAFGLCLMVTISILIGAFGKFRP